MNRNHITNIMLTSCFLTGVVYVIWYIGSGHFEHNPTPNIWISSYVMGGVTVVLAALIPSRPFMVGPMGLSGIMIGAILTAILDSADHNLFPIAVFCWAGLATPGILVGNIVGGAAFWLRKRLCSET